ncbi:MAG: hypothetical protein ACRCTA_06505, partial [Bacilli bacterium]
MKIKLKAILNICFRKITQRKTRTMMNMLVFTISIILLVGYGSIINTFIQGLNNFNYIVNSGIKANGYFMLNGSNQELYDEITTTSKSSIALKMEYDILVKDEVFNTELNSLVSLNQSYLDRSAIKMKDGHLPTTDEEIVLPNNYRELLHQNIELQLELEGQNRGYPFKVVGLYEVVNGNTNFRHLIVNENFKGYENVISEYYVSSPTIKQDKMLEIASKYDVEYNMNPHKALNTNLYLGIGIFLIALLIFTFIKNINEIFTKIDE